MKSNIFIREYLSIDYVKVLNNFVKMEVPQQENSYDCGMYVVEFTGFIAKYFMDKFGEKKDKNKDKDDGKVNDKDKDKDQDKDKQYPSISIQIVALDGL